MPSFLENYEIFTSGNECPKNFHTWGGLSALANLVSGRVWTDGGIYMVFPNMYIIFVGDPGAKKSTAMRLAARVIYEFKRIPYAPASITKEAMVQMMAKEDSPCALAFKHEDKMVKFTHLSIFASELINLINAGGNPGGMIDFFTDVWDRCDSEFRETTKNKGDNLIIRPFISITGCMTTDTVKTLQSLKIISSGMTRRCLFIHGSRSDRPIAFPDVTPEQRRAFQEIVAWGVRLQNVAGEFQWSPEAKAKYKELYDRGWAEKQKATSKILQEFLETKFEYVIKIAMLLWLSERTDALVLSEENIIKAHDLVTSVQDGGSLLFEGAGRNQLARISQEIFAHVFRSPNQMVPLKQILFTFRSDATVEEITTILQEEERLDRLKVAELSLGNVQGKFVLTVPKYKELVKAQQAKKQAKQQNHE